MFVGRSKKEAGIKGGGFFWSKRRKAEPEAAPFLSQEGGEGSKNDHLPIPDFD